MLKVECLHPNGPIELLSLPIGSAKCFPLRGPIFTLSFVGTISILTLKYLWLFKLQHCPTVNRSKSTRV